MLLSFALALQIATASSPALAPGTQYDAKVPTLKQVVGHEPGEKITTPEEIAIYLRALNQAAPDRARLVEYARTWEDRPLWLFIVGSPERIARLEQVKADLRRIGDPRGLSSSDGDRFVRELPVVTWLMHGVHGYGLFDITGNVWEWCADWYAPDAYRTAAVTDRGGPAEGTERVMRGGSWMCSENFCSNYRVAGRSRATPETGLNNLGFRLVKDR